MFPNLKQKEPMSKHTTLCLGGPADYFLEVKNQEELIFLLRNIEKYNIPFYIIGGGSNLLFSDEGFRGIVIKLTGEFEKIEIEGETAVCGAGLNLAFAVKKTIDNSLSGLEYFGCIAGTVGGAVYGNAGLKNIWIDSAVKSVEILDYSGLSKKLERKEIKFGYRSSGLKKVIITRVEFILKKADKNDILNTVSQETQQRKKSQPLGAKSAGCIFKNPQAQSAGSLIDSLGLKNYSVGNIQISNVHANFFINKGQGSSKDMLSLINFVQQKVKEKFNTNLETEIKIIK